MLRGKVAKTQEAGGNLLPKEKQEKRGLLVQTLTSKEMLPPPEGSPLITGTITLGIESDILA